MSVTITLNLNGPIKVEGDVVLQDHAGQPIATTPGKAIFLCRCGQSAKKPFCDGTHKRIGFVGTSEPAAG
jgi:CDGSH-type Zn-finger protein